jgi:cation transport ATPase
MNITQHYSSKAELDFVVHVDDLLDEQNMQRVEHALLKVTGVERARFNYERQHLLIIGYNPAQINSSKILKLVKKQQINAHRIESTGGRITDSVGRQWPH